MLIAPINNTNFNAKFKKTKALNSLLECADHSTLDRFNKVLTRAGKIDDKKIFKVSATTESRLGRYGKQTDYDFKLLSHPEHDKNSIAIENNGAFRYYHFSDKIALWDNCLTVFKNFVSTLEKEYPQKESNMSRNKLIQKISEKLI